MNKIDSENSVLKGLHFLVAEDDDLNCEIIKTLLEMEGASCDIAKNGLMVLDQFEKHGQDYDAILMDVQMPIMNGYDATKAIRRCRHPKAKSIIIVAMTASGFSADVKAALDAGMNSHVAKPVDMEEFKEEMKKMLLAI